MRILLTGVTGYIGKRLLPVLVNLGYTVVCCVRDKNRLFLKESLLDKTEIIEADFLVEKSLQNIPKDIEAAFYLIHSMTSTIKNFDKMEALAAGNFAKAMENTNVRQVVYLSGISNEVKLSKHLSSRRNVETILSQRKFKLTVLRAGIVVGSGSSSFEIIRDLVEKLPFLITPKWVLTRIQPIAVGDVVAYLSQVLFNERCFNRSFDIGGPEVLTYRDMLLQYAEVRKLKRYFIVLPLRSFPLMTPRASSMWMYFISSVSYPLVVNLINSLRVEVVCRNNDIENILQLHPISYKTAIERAFSQIKQNLVVSSWRDSLSSTRIGTNLADFIEVPEYGCYKDKKQIVVHDVEKVIDNIWSIGGERGWYYSDWLWKFLGFIDILFGGVGLKRGRTRTTDIHAGDALDFWRVLLADKQIYRFLLFAELKLPGEAWLEFRIDKNNILSQVLTFRPKGVFGRFYWLVTYPFRYIIFNGMIENIEKV